MKKLLVILAVAFLFCTEIPAFAAPQAADTLSGSKRTEFGYAQDIASSSATLTLKAGVTGQYVTLYGLIVSVDAADYWYLTCGGVQKTARKWLPASSGLSQVVYPLYIRCGSGEALAIVRGAAATKMGADHWTTQEP